MKDGQWLLIEITKWNVHSQRQDILEYHILRTNNRRSHCLYSLFVSSQRQPTVRNRIFSKAAHCFLTFAQSPLTKLLLSCNVPMRVFCTSQK